MTNRKREEDIESAIDTRDSAALRRMADTADKEDSRIWLTLLSDIVERNALKARVRT